MNADSTARRPASPAGSPSPERDVFRGVVLRLAGLTAVLLLISQGVVSYLLAETFEDVLLPEIRRKAEVAGELAAEQVGYALSLGIPLESLVEMDVFLDGVLERNPDFVYLSVADSRDVSLYTRGVGLASEHPGGTPDLVLPIMVDEQPAAFLHAGLHEGAVRSELAELRLDIATVLLATLLVGVELLVAFVVVRVSGPIRLADRVLNLGAQGDFARRLGLRSKDEVGRFAATYNAAVRRINTAFAELTEEAEDARAVQLDRKVQERIRHVVAGLRDRFRFTAPGSEDTIAPRSPMDVRIPLFLFMLSQELSRPFLPLFFNEIYTPIAGLSRELAIGLPITAFMTMVLVAIPIAGALSDRFPPRMMFLFGMIPSVVGHVGAAFSSSVAEVLLWWMLSGVGYGVIFISAQAYVAHNTERTARAVGMSGFLGAVFAAFVCGPAIGGILADRVGYEQTLLVAAALCLVLRRGGTGHHRFEQGSRRRQVAAGKGSLLAAPAHAPAFSHGDPVLRPARQVGARGTVLLSGAAVSRRSGQHPVERRPGDDGLRNRVRCGHPPCREAFGSPRSATPFHRTRWPRHRSWLCAARIRRLDRTGPRRGRDHGGGPRIGDRTPARARAGGRGAFR